MGKWKHGGRRPGAGRPLEGEEPLTERIMVRWRPSELTRIDGYRGARSRSAYIRDLVIRTMGALLAIALLLAGCAGGPPTATADAGPADGCSDLFSPPVDLARSSDGPPTYEDLLQPADQARPADLADTGCGGEGQAPCSWGCSAPLAAWYPADCAKPRGAVCADPLGSSCGSYPLACCRDSAASPDGLCSASTYCYNSKCEPCP